MTVICLTTSRPGRPRCGYYPDRPADIDHYWHVMNRLVTDAESPDATMAILRRLAEEI